MIPERNLNPPEDTRRVAYSCELCEEPIYEGDDYYDIDGIGRCCEECIEGSKRLCAEVDERIDEAYERMREEGFQW